MNTSNDSQSRKDPVLETYQQVHHEKNAFIAGDRVYMWKNIKGKPIRVWRTVKSVDIVEGKLYLEDSKRGVTIYGPNEKKYDNIITTDAWEKAFGLLNEVWTKKEARENRMNSVVSCDTIDGYLCVVISCCENKTVTKWYVRCDTWSLLKTENAPSGTGIMHNRKSRYKGQVGNPKAVIAGANEKLFKPLLKDWIILNTRGKFLAWNRQFAFEIGEQCPWLRTMNAPWARPGEKARNCNPFDEEGRDTLVLDNNAKATFSEDGKTLEHCPNVEKYEIPEGVTTVFSDAFHDCPNLQEISFPSTLITVIEHDGSHPYGNIFSECQMLKKIVVSPENKYYDSRENCNAIIETTTYTEDDVEYEIARLLYACSSTKIPNGVDVIEECAFDGCSIKEIFIPESVSLIYIPWFGPSLERILVSDKNLQFDSRENCNAIIETSTNTLVLGCSNTRIPDSVVCIQGGAFAQCEKLKSVIIPRNVVRIGNGGFSYTPVLQEIIVDDRNIYYDSREKCNAIIDTTNDILVAGCGTTAIPKSVKKIGCFAFRNCLSLKSIIIPEGVEEIGEGAFAGCINLKSIAFPSSLRRIAGYRDDDYGWALGAFNGCSSLEEISIPDNVTEIEGYVFCDCRSLKTIRIHHGVKSIGEEAFKNCLSLEEIVIPDSVTRIGWNAFEGCKKLRSIAIPNSVKKIEDSFYECESLEEIIIPNGVTEIGPRAFYGTNIKSIHIPNSVTRIGAEAFSCTSLDEIIIPDSVIEIGKGAFSVCSNLRRVILSNNVKKITEKAFEWCISLEGILIPNGVTEIEERAFGSCVDHLKSIIIPNSTTKIGKGAFSDCRALKSITISEGVKSIGESVFSGCPIEEIVIPRSVTEIADSAFNGCNKLKRVFISKGVTRIGEDAFNSCSSLEEITLPNSVTEIGKRAFSECSNLKNIVIPNSVAKIGEEAFCNCSSLLEVHLPASIVELDSPMFYDYRWDFMIDDNKSDVNAKGDLDQIEDDPFPIEIIEKVIRKVFVPKGEIGRFKAMGLDGDNIILIEE